MSCQRDQNNGRDNLVGNDVNFYRIFFLNIQADYTKYHCHEEFADRRKKAVARTYFYMNEAQCERNMDTFLQSIEAVSGN